MAMEDSGCSFTLSSLICREDGSLLDDDYGGEEEVVVFVNDSEAEDEYLETLVSKETSFATKTHDSYSSDASSAGGGGGGTWFKRARSDAVRWILKNKACFGFGIQTAYLAVAYFDRFFARRAIEEGKSWAVKLSALACLSLAAKMEEIRVPALPEFQTEEYQFHSEVIQRMELLVLSTLDWRMSSITPFAYLSYFAAKFRCESKVEDLLSRAIGLIFAVLEVMSLADCRPSAIAAGAILAASGQVLTKKSVESKMSIASICGSLESEQVFSCYSMMIQESHKEMLKPSKVFISSSENSSVDVIDAIDSASFTATSSNKRRRLELPHLQ